MRIAKHPSRLRVPQYPVRDLVEAGVDVECSNVIRCAFLERRYSQYLPPEWTNGRNRGDTRCVANTVHWSEASPGGGQPHMRSFLPRHGIPE